MQGNQFLYGINRAIIKKNNTLFKLAFKYRATNSSSNQLDFLNNPSLLILNKIKAFKNNIKLLKYIKDIIDSI